MLLGIARANREVKTEPAPEVLVTSLGDGHVSVQLRAWVDAQSHARLQSALMESVLGEYHVRGLALPRPQREVHVFHHGGDAGAVSEAMLKPAL
jgi:small-conductance mechanosensitive channel